MLPSLVAHELRRTLTDFLGTTFALTDDDVRAELERFLLDPDRGIFRGPFVRVRLPFRPAGAAWRDSLDWAPEGFVPYEHQARAFQRLDSRAGRPLPTIVTTGTGSGKTESFLLPLLDHCRRERAMGRAGVKALMLYPMNALANDQARRIAQAVAASPELEGVRVGLYTGDQGSVREMDGEHVIDHRDTLRKDPPDILLTNYKMLDFLLLRHEDRGLWESSRQSLRYLVLDEFHTYDGAQGTDVAMLLRRLGATLGVARPGQPLGDITPVATSATLGDGEDGRAALLSFAAEVFGETFDDDAVIGETRLTPGEWIAAGVAPSKSLPPGAGRDEAPTLAVALATFGELRRRRTHPSHEELAVLAWALFTGQAEEWLDGKVIALPDAVGVGSRLRHHPLTARLLREAARPVALDELIATVAPSWAVRGNREMGRDLLSGFLALLSLARVRDAVGNERPLLQVDVQVWIRELRRLLRRVAPSIALRWEADAGADGFDVHLPAVYCRHCGRSGWAALRPPAGRALILDPKRVWTDSPADRSRVVALLHAAGEATEEAQREGVVRWFVPRTAELVSVMPEDDEDAVPVLEPGDKDDARRQKCPACGLDDGIRFLGSRVATLTSVVLGHLFGSPDVEERQKKTLVFTDSVQDAAHRAAFVESRAFALNQRALVATAVGGDGIGGAGGVTLDAVGERMLRRAVSGSLEDRYAVLPPEVKQHPGFIRFWSQLDVDGETRDRVQARLQFAAVQEFGLNSRTGRSLELTGTVTAQVVVNRVRALRRDLERAADELPDLQLSLIDGTPRWMPWVYGVLERMRTMGAVEHPWFDRYIAEDGNRWSIWGGRDRETGMPAFPRGRPAPVYPATSAPRDREVFDVITSTRGWYATWTKRCLQVPSTDAPRLMRMLLDTLERRGMLSRRTTGSGATVWLIPASGIKLTATTGAADHSEGSVPPVLRCSACAQRLPGAQDLRDAMTGAPCLRDRCPGVYLVERPEPDYYRSLYASRAVRRIVATEHTGLLAGDVRARVETSFKNPVSPDAPNVLACTPTLELGIDIGDLSIVTLTSLPRSTAAYLQRVGRAGRATGSALVVSVLPSRPLELRRLADPLSLIAGDVVPPACHLDAGEILRRQYLAFLIDRSARAGVVVPQKVSEVLGRGVGPESWLGRLLSDVRPVVAERVEEFLALFGDRLAEDTRAELRAYACPGPAGEAAPLEETVADAARRWAADREERGRRIARLKDELDRLDALGDALDDEAEHDRRRVRGELARAQGADREARMEYWISGLEAVGLLPNYALLDDRTTLDVALWWTDEETGKSEVAESQYARGSRVALRELAPGAVFYVRGSMLHIDAVELGTPGNPATVEWRCCPSCGWSDADPGPVPCPRCGNVRCADTGQRFTVVPFRGASAYEPRDRALAGDTNDERERTPFTVLTTVDVPPEAVASAWRLKDVSFGVEFSRRAQVRWFNLGPEHSGGRTRDLAGWSGPAPLFHACRSCGVVPAAQAGPGGRRPAPQDARHRGWCPQRQEYDPDGWVDVALTHALRTQVLRMLVPPVVMADDTLLVSFRAALLLGLRTLLGGDPDHLDVAVTMAGPPSASRHVMVLHDLVPGGTGYLAQISAPDQVRALFEVALAQLRACPCTAEAVLACHRCLLAHVAPRDADHARRDRAIELLTELLDRWEPETVAGIEEISSASHESPLEVRFRQMLRAWLDSRAVTVTQTPDDGGERWDFRLPGAGGTDVSWTLRPQVPVLDCRPDFLLTTPSMKDGIAVFTDGVQFHASVTHNRIADDAAKRRALRQQGYLVWSLTHEDIDGFVATEATWDQATSLRPHAIGPLRWATEAQRQGYLSVARKLATAAGGGSVAPEALSGDAMTLLVRLLQQPDVGSWRQPARAAGLALVTSGFDRQLATDEAASAAAEAAVGTGLESDAEPIPGAAHAGTAPPRQAAVRLTSYGAGITLMRRAGRSPAVDAVIAVDDRTEVIGSPHQVDAWRDWLALTNVLQLAGDGPIALDAVTVTEVVAPVLGPEQSGVDGAAGGDLSAGEQVLRALLDEADPDCHNLIRRLTPQARLDLVIGYETDDGVPIELAWPDIHRAVVTSIDPQTQAWFETNGWTYTRVEAGDALPFLQLAGLIESGSTEGSPTP